MHDSRGIRLSDRDLEIIKQSFIKHFLDKDHLWIFGSRVDPSKRGGDIDLYIETTYEDVSIAVDSKIAFYSELQELLGEQKIDIILNILKLDYNLPIYEVAKVGIKLV
ncbi:hypothetical protein [Candidatus Trichorickettsia mobilis]|uniref:hypothetical protein n=1 Tax=Candidatus Trichorickettsia mobilis TaxID=1346319 RepID=UPI0029316066|nr:hypothetical protein [Candidatus Trichorickettsia mobilis]